MYNINVLKVIKVLITFIILFTTGNVKAKHIHHEKVYQEYFCGSLNGKSEYVLPDRTRIDCLTDEYAIEVDFAKKWSEAIGQSLYYSYCTKREPGILLILESEKDEKHLHKIQPLVKLYGIRLWLIRPENLPDKDFKNEQYKTAPKLNFRFLQSMPGAV